MIRVAVAVLACALAGCGGKQNPGPGPAGDGNASDAAVATAPAADAGSDTAAPVEGELSAAECDRFVDHVVEMAVEVVAKTPLTGKDGKTLPPERNTDAEIATIKAKLRSDLRGECVAIPRALYECAMKAGTKDELGACQTSGGETAPPR